MLRIVFLHKSVESSAVIAHEIDGSPVVAVLSDFYSSAGLFASKLPRISNKIFQHDLEQPWISLDAEPFGNNKLYLSGPVCVLQLRRNTPR